MIIGLPTGTMLTAIVLVVVAGLGVYVARGRQKASRSRAAVEDSLP
jgi:hypothetical protein